MNNDEEHHDHGEHHGDEKHHDKTFKIIVNGDQVIWEHERISYSEAVDLVFPPPHKDTEVFTVQYSKGPHDHREGTLVEGESVEVKNNMVFNVQRTDKS